MNGCLFGRKEIKCLQKRNKMLIKFDEDSVEGILCKIILRREKTSMEDYLRKKISYAIISDFRNNYTNIETMHMIAEYAEEVNE